MSYSKLINPKKKRRVFDSRGPPFPVPISSIIGEPSSARQWMYYTGNLVGNQVIVHHTGDINYLYKMVILCTVTGVCIFYLFALILKPGLLHENPVLYRLSQRVKQLHVYNHSKQKYQILTKLHLST